jgi:hypothetical protein
MSVRHAARIERVRLSGGADVNQRDVLAEIRKDGHRGWHSLDVSSNVGWRKVLYRRAAVAEREAAEAAEEAAAAETLGRTVGEQHFQRVRLFERNRCSTGSE